MFELVVARPDRTNETYSPEVVHQHVEHAEKHNKDNGTPLSLETNDDHDARDQAEQANQNAPEAPLAGENKSNEQEDQEHTASKLDVHLAVLLVKLGQTGWDKLLAHPGVRQHHEKTTDDTQVSQEEVQIKDETVPNTLGNNHDQQSRDGEFGLLAGDDEGGANGHGNNVDDQEKVCESPRD